MKSKKVFMNVCVALIIGAVFGLILFGTVEYLSERQGWGDGINYTISLSQVGDKPVTYLVNSYNFINNNWINFTTMDGVEMIVNVEHCHVLIEKSKEVLKTSYVKNQDEEYSMYASVSPIGRTASHYLLVDYEILDESWVRLIEPNDKSVVINTHNYNVCIEKTPNIPEFQKKKTLLEERLNGFEDFSAVPKS